MGILKRKIKAHIEETNSGGFIIKTEGIIDNAKLGDLLLAAFIHVIRLLSEDDKAALNVYIDCAINELTKAKQEV